MNISTVDVGKKVVDDVGSASSVVVIVTSVIVEGVSVDVTVDVVVVFFFEDVEVEAVETVEVVIGIVEGTVGIVVKGMLVIFVALLIFFIININI